MSKSAGTLTTTYNATYISPRFMPGYSGHVPTMKFDYAETYGNHTAKYFQDFRLRALDTSKSNYCRGGYFPSYYSNNGNLAAEAQTRKLDRWLSTSNYQLSSTDHDRQEHLLRFQKLSQAHRDHYNDKSGTANSVSYFTLPTINN
jgi:hypothetical protein